MAFLPGALFVRAFERLAGQFGIQRKDRVLRFVGTETTARNYRSVQAIRELV